MGFDYTVSGKDKGLTYIFLEQAKKQAGFDSSKRIDWNSVMTVFDEIQQEEKQEGQQLFHGGTDKTSAGWRTSYIIKEGDKISLSENQMNRIYEAMGVELGGATQPTPPVADQNPPVQQTPPAADQNPPAQPTPPAADQNPPVKDLTPPPADADLLLNKSPLDLNSLLPDLNKASQTVLNPDGTSSEYNGDGYLVREYDSAGNMTRGIRRSANGSVKWYVDYEYDSAGNRTRDIARSANGSVESCCDYEYDSAGNKTREILRNPDGSVEWYEDYEYDSAGNETREILRNSDGSVEWYYDYEYDSAGNLTREIERNSDGSVKYYVDYEYDSAGNETRKIWRRASGSVKWYVDYEYDSAGNQTREILRNPDGSER